MLHALRAFAGRTPAVLAALSAVIALATGCRPHKPAEDPHPAAYGAHRDIPIVFFVLSGHGERNPTSDDDIVGAVSLANAVYAAADIQFYIADVRRIETDELHRIDGGSEQLPWSRVARDAMAIAPDIAKAGFNDSHRMHRAGWIHQVAARLPYDIVPVFVATFAGADGQGNGSNCASAFPNNDGKPYFVPPGKGPPWSLDGSRAIACVPGALPGRRIHSLAHELGHFLAGLPHTFEVGDPPDEPRWTFWDLLYAVSADQRHIVRFNSEDQARAAGQYAHPIDSGCWDCKPTARRIVPGSKCVVEVKVETAAGVLQFDSEHSPKALEGLVYPPTGPTGEPALNIMSYLYQDPTHTPCEMRLSPSQIALVKKRIVEPLGHRNLLGTVPRPHWTGPVAAAPRESAPVAAGPPS